MNEQALKQRYLLLLRRETALLNAKKLQRDIAQIFRQRGIPYQLIEFGDDELKDLQALSPKSTLYRRK